MGLAQALGYDSGKDMFDGGGKGGSGDTFSTGSNEDYQASGGTDNDTSFGDKVQATVSSAFSGTDSDGIKGKAPQGITQYTSVGLIGKLAGWANGLKPAEDQSTVVDGRTVYTSADGMQYSHNALGLPYEVTVQDGAVVDTLSIRGEDGMTGYERMAEEARARGDNDAADAIMQEAEANAEEAPVESAISQDNILKMITDSGVAKSNEEITALVNDPKSYLDARGINLSDIIPSIDPETAGTLLDPANPNYALGDLATYNAATIDGVDTVGEINPRTGSTYIADTAADRIVGNSAATVDAQTGTVGDDSLVDADGITIDMQGAATGVNADGTVNETGQALNDFATQNISKIIDTSTAGGKLLADKLGEGNYTDSKSTILGQMDIISAEFKDSNGNPTIPPWAQSISRSVNRTMAFDGVTGTAGMAAMSNAIMEATLGIAEKEASFFQTLTIQNLDNRQQAIINKANVLSQFEVSNLGARQAAAVQNAQAFLEMDLTNLTNEQQAEVVNTQAVVQALMEDTKQENLQRRFTAETDNQFTQFYDELGVQVQEFNASLVADMKRFNAGEINDASEFNNTMENQRQQFYSKMQYAVDEANVQWRQTVATTNTEMAFDAAATDVKNYLDISQEGLNRMWDRTDATLDYLYKAAALEEEFELRLLLGEMTAAANTPQKSSLFDTLLGGAIKIGAAYAGSDVRLKQNVRLYDVLNGINYYTWDWNDEARAIGYDQYPTMGVLAQEVQKTHPEAVIEGPHGYLMVNYGKLKDEV